MNAKSIRVATLLALQLGNAAWAGDTSPSQLAPGLDFQRTAALDRTSATEDGNAPSAMPTVTAPTTTPGDNDPLPLPHATLLLSAIAAITLIASRCGLRER